MSIPDAGERASYRYKFANAEYDEASATLSVDGQAVGLEPRPSHLLAELLHHVNEVVTKEELFDRVWDGRPTVDNVFANAIAKLRKALGEKAAERIVTVPKIGYRFDGPVERIATGSMASSALDFKEGQPVPGRPSFVLDHPLGSSNRGHVWLAHHQKIRTQLRVFKFAPDAERLRVLKREYTLYRVLQAELGDRPDLARLLDSNFSEAPFHIECEYGGVDLLSWAADPAAPLAAMSQSQRLGLFLQIARAVAAAHSVGVLHKDLKPSNVLISSESDAWVVKLTDFGSGRATDPGRLKELGLTELGMTLAQDASSTSISGTAMYLAPEVLAGKAPSTQSDVYSLGVVLFQLLAGDLRKPMATGWERHLGDEALRADIAAATEGQMEERLGSVAELVDRVLHHEERMQEIARHRESTRRLEQAESDQRRQRLRRPWQIGLAASLMLGLVTTTALYLQANRARALAATEAGRARAINEFLTQDILKSADFAHVANDKLMTVAELLSRASARADVRFKDQPLTEAVIRRQLGEVDLKLMASHSALKELRTAISLLEPRVPRQDIDLLASRFALARALSQNYLAKEGVEVLKTAERDAAGPLLHSPELAYTAKLARLEVMMALQEDKAAIPVAKDLIAIADSSSTTDLSDRFEARQRLAELYIRVNDIPQAQALLAQIMKAPFGSENVSAVTFALARISVAKTLLANGKTSEAQELLQQSRDTLLAVLGPKSFQVGLVDYELANVTRQDDPKGSLQLQREAYSAFAASLGESHNYTKSMAMNLAIGEIETGDPAAGLKSMEVLTPWYRSRVGTTDGIDVSRAEALNKLRRHAEALAVLDGVDPEKFLWAMQETKGQSWQIQAERGIALVGLGRKAEGRSMLEDAVSKMRKDGAAASFLNRYDVFARTRSNTKSS